MSNKTEMEDKIRELFTSLSPQDKNFLGGLHHTENIIRELRNHFSYIQGDLPSRQRVNMGIPYLKDSKVIGYCTFTVMQDARPNNYDQKFIGLKEPVNYLHFKKLVVHPDFRNQGIATELIQYRLRVANRLGKDAVCDVEKENESIIKLLTENGFKNSFHWKTRKGTEMIRLTTHSK
ncbi:MAG: GNAT family N-acetyltransferase [Nanoarchaeota archaeon]|nr:GNAT family N-acetyltransferase [Nanoarchaeota archaeon]